MMERGTIVALALAAVLPGVGIADHHEQAPAEEAEAAIAIANPSATAGNKVKVEFTYYCPNGNEDNDLVVEPGLVLVCREGKNCKNQQVEWTVPQGLVINEQNYILRIRGKVDDGYLAACFPTQEVKAGGKKAGKEVKDQSGKAFDACANSDWYYGAVIHKEGDESTVCASIDPGVIIRD